MPLALITSWYDKTSDEKSRDSLSGGEIEDCTITNVEPRQLNHGDSSVDSDIECIGVELPKPPSLKRQRKTILDYFPKETAPGSSQREYPEFLRRYEPTDVPCRPARGSKSNSQKKLSPNDLASASRQDSI